jgi:predicted NBD/HSP70 family sugar kinase
MYLAIDVGGTKTLVAALTNDGNLKKSIKFKTPSDYTKFLSALTAAAARFNEYNFSYASVAIPGKLDRTKGMAIAFGNLDWKNKPIKKDLRAILPCKFIIENDANLAGYYEARQVLGTYKRALYLTISTGIGSGIINNGVIDQDFQDSEAGQMSIQYNDAMHQWEDIASGSAIKKRYGKIAAEINDTKTWREICHRLAIGMNALIATIQPDVIIIGGGVGTHFGKYSRILKSELKKMSTPLTPVPAIIKAKKPEEAVIYGCYTLAKKTHHESIS